MRSFFLVVVAVIFLFSPAQIVTAQSPEMPLPSAVVKDADGKIISALFSLATPANSSTAPRPTVLLEINGETVVVEVTPGNLLVMCPRGYAVFSGTDCTGDVAITYTDFNLTGCDLFVRKPTFIGGPNEETGGYRVFQAISNTRTQFSRASQFSYLGVCENVTPGVGNFFAAEEVLPNPLEGFHGPTTANPERVLTIEGGTRLP